MHTTDKHESIVKQNELRYLISWRTRGTWGEILWWKSHSQVTGKVSQTKNNVAEHTVIWRLRVCASSWRETLCDFSSSALSCSTPISIPLSTKKKKTKYTWIYLVHSQWLSCILSRVQKYYVWLQLESRAMFKSEQHRVNNHFFWEENYLFWFWMSGLSSTGLGIVFHNSQ